MARVADPDIRADYIYVEGRCCSDPLCFSGTAHPFVSTWDTRWGKRRYISHPAGKITFTIGTNVWFSDLIRLFAHELRHIGQFNRGLQQYGVLTTDPMTNQETEADAYAFEERILAKLGL